VFALKYRIKFSKTGKIRFIGHLDLLKTFQRAIKRAGIPIAYSNGFNPHQLIGFAVPLPLGMAGFGEYADIVLNEELSDCEIVSKLNEAMPDGVEIISAKRLMDNSKGCAASVCAALYEIYLPDKIDGFSDIIKNMLAMDSIIIDKKGKRDKVKKEDIRPYIFSIDEILDYCGGTAFNTIIATGSGSNLKPDLLVKYIYTFINLDYSPLEVKYKRIELFQSNGNDFSPLYSQNT